MTDEELPADETEATLLILDMVHARMVKAEERVTRLNYVIWLQATMLLVLALHILRA